MNVLPVELDLQLPENGLVDLFLVQWHTPEPISGDNWQRMPDSLVEQKDGILLDFFEWMKNDYSPSHPALPVFVLFPELSMPQQSIPRVLDLLNSVTHPLIVIAGLEYIQCDTYRDMVNSCQPTISPTSWLDGLQEGEVMNVAGIWIREQNGSTQQCFKLNAIPITKSPRFWGTVLMLLYFALQSNHQVKG